MPIKSLAYEEHTGDPELFWKLEKGDFSNLNLVVGRNSTGKTRLINVLNGLVGILSGRLTTPFVSGKYDAEIVVSEKHYRILIEFNDSKVINESVIVDGELKLERFANGKGKVWYEQENKYI